MSNELYFTNLWFLANPNPVHGMGESDKKTSYSLEPGSCQSNLMALKANPNDGSLPGPSRLWKKLFFFECHLIP